MDSATIRVKCLAIANKNFVNTPYIGLPTAELYAPDGFANKASEICHYCTVETLKAILESGSMRFTDVRFLNDSTEFSEAINWVPYVLKHIGYSEAFKNFILESDEFNSLKSYTQSCNVVSGSEYTLKENTYHVYTCSFSTNANSLSMWNYYGKTSSGLNIVFDHAWNLFDGSDESEINSRIQLKNDIEIYRGLIIYSNEQKEQCIKALLDEIFALYEEVKNDIDTYKKSILYAFKEAINNIRCFFKNEAFSCEEEYRVVLKFPEDLLLKKDASNDSDILNKGTILRGNVLVPFVDYKFNKDAIKEIVLNPYAIHGNEMFKMGLQNLLFMHGLQEVQILHSAIPIRKYD